MDARTLGVYADVDAALLLAMNGEAAEALPLAVDTAALRAGAAEFAARHNCRARDAAAVYRPGAAEPFAFTGERTGVTVDEDALCQAVLRAVGQGQTRIEAPCSVQEPALTEEALRARHRLLGTFTTSFAKSPHNAENRVFNIRKAAAAIDGTVLAPGETFDCNAVLGDRNEQNGWRMAAGIRNGRYVQEYGGGVCQVSSTLFNAVVDGEAQTLTVSLYGEPALPDGQYVEVVSERTGTLPALPDEVLLDESLPAGTRVVEREGRQGRTARTVKRYYAANGTLLREEIVYEDTYRSIAARIYVSTDLYAEETAAAAAPAG